MKSRPSLPTSAGLVSVAIFAGSVSSCWGTHLAAAQTAEPGKAGAPIAAYAWPTEASPEPTEAEWAGATELDIPFRKQSSGWRRSSEARACVPLAVREWVRIVCPPPRKGSESDARYGVVWGLGGDLSAVKAKLFPASESELHKAPSTDRMEQVARQTGASATITVQLRPGSAFVLAIDRISSSWEYDGGFSVSSLPDRFIDVSWAKGEKAPTIACH
jgi:hypothetical protein